MAEDTEPSQKTEAPSQRRLEEARAKGQLVVSREVGTLLLLATASLLAGAAAADSARGLVGLGRALLAQATLVTFDVPALERLLWALAGELGRVLALPLLALLAAPIAAAILQNAVVWTSEPLQPKLERISPLAGAKRLFSLRSLLELAKSVAKVLLVGSALSLLLWPEAPAMIASSGLEVGPLLGYLADLLTRTFMVLALAAAIVAAVDYAHQRAEFMRQMRMSRQELQDELKQSDGDPHTKQRLRGLRLERARRRMIADVPRATVVITNPTHVAVALRYAPGETAAPEVLAKGVDSLALKIRQIAAANGVPVIENAPLARALHAGCDIGDLIPPAHYQAVAEIISYVLRLGQRP
ncbi:MAG: flagellar biosynthesis protein FlhB [Geminicoccaceae bacterium]